MIIVSLSSISNKCFYDNGHGKKKNIAFHLVYSIMIYQYFHVIEHLECF